MQGHPLYQANVNQQLLTGLIGVLNIFIELDIGHNTF
jgi:hypothetical protein